MGVVPHGSPRAIIGLMALVGAACQDPPPPASDDGSGSDSSGAVVSSEVGGSTSAPTLCEPGQTRACYEGPFGTADVGLCRSGSQTCSADGMQWSSCEGEVWPQEAERCDTPEDDDCDGTAVCYPQFEWTRKIPGSIRWIEDTPDGGVVVIGDGNGKVDEIQLLGPYVLSLDSAGELRWKFDWPTGQIEIHAMTVDPDGDVVFVGQYYGAPDFGGGPVNSSVGLDAFAVRYDADGNHRWSHVLSPSGYTEVAVDGEGRTYVMGENINTVFDDETVLGDFFVAGLDVDGQLDWVTPGEEAYYASPYMSLSASPSGEVMALMVLGQAGREPSIDGNPLPIEIAAPVAVWLDHDGEVLSHRILTDGLDESKVAFGVERMIGYPRPDGWMTMTDTYTFTDGDLEQQVLLIPFDAQYEPLSTAFIGGDVFVPRIDAYGSQDTVAALEFTGSLELGPVGLVGSTYQPRYAVAVFDDHAQGHWVEMLHADENAYFSGVAATSDGAVYVGGWAAGLGVLAGEQVDCNFIARLRP